MQKRPGGNSRAFSVFLAVLKTLNAPASWRSVRVGLLRVAEQHHRHGAGWACARSRLSPTPCRALRTEPFASSSRDDLAQVSFAILLSGGQSFGDRLFVHRRRFSILRLFSRRASFSNRRISIHRRTSPDARRRIFSPSLGRSF
jgi:hypothetical protein